jgi:hypothetical protein
MRHILLLILLITIIWTNQNYAHGQHVHQYIVKEAYELLVTQWGSIIPNMHDHVGGIGSEYHGSYAWHKPFIMTGAWREDEEDPVFNYDFVVIQGVNIALVSITHFWDADHGDLSTNEFPIVLPIFPYPSVNIGPYENAYDKLLKYRDGGWVLWFPDIISCTNAANGNRLIITPGIVEPPDRFGISLEYTSLTSFYNNSSINLLSDQNGQFTVFDSTALQFISPNSVSQILVDDYVGDRIVWGTLGRMCHLLADMSVPAHTHRDEHGLEPDSYENWMSGDPHLEWNHQNVGDFINPYTSDNEPLHYLIYTMHQQADHFGSNGPGDVGNGNDIIGGDPRTAEVAFLNSVNLSSFGNPTTFSGPWSVENLQNIRDKTYPYIIRATAGLLFWFAFETMMISNIEDEKSIPTSFYLEQNYPNPFNPSTKIRFTIPSQQYPLLGGDYRGGLTTLTVYDILGNEIATLINEEKPAGTYEVEWNASGLPSGIYFYQLKTDSLVETKKMILLR